LIIGIGLKEDFVDTLLDQNKEEIDYIFEKRIRRDLREKDEMTILLSEIKP